ncbi:hypothetical protein [Rugamonas aquatica]|uniref:Uncharacterized protein n=1 Tax=Rugamonas aquatica TaxID=2743357 RepID=A0A6A7N0G2_9BURK|nr:hypothetical protein [Rugamonas aquatica]MQA38512.1 hypothetical protein [Rugamonas aquatica]
MDPRKPCVVAIDLNAFQINENTTLLVQVTDKQTEESKQVTLDRQQGEVVDVAISEFRDEPMLLRASLLSGVVTWESELNPDCPKNVLKLIRAVQFAQKMLIGRGGYSSNNDYTDSQVPQ